MAVMVHGSHELFRVATAVKPEGRVIAGSGCRLEIRCRIFKQHIERKRLSRRADIFTQMVLHGMQHRSECAVILTNLGHSPGNIDYIVYLRG